MIIKQIIEDGITKLNSNRIEDAKFNVLCIAAKLLQCANSRVPLYYKENADETFKTKFNRMIERRIRHEPLQYIIGEWDFLDFTIKSDKRALIPRPETEEVFYAAKKLIESHIIPNVGENFKYADIGTGSGVLGIAMARTFNKAFGYLSDISEKALDLAKENVKNLVPNHENKIEFKISDLVSNFTNNMLDVIISNPPYIKKSDIESLMPEVSLYEPHLALDGGCLGFEIPAKLISDSKQVLKKGGLLIIEHGDGQQHELLKMFDKNKWKNFEGKKDLRGKERYIYGILD